MSDRVVPVSLAELERRAASDLRPEADHQGALISCERVVRIFTADGVEVQALRGLDLEVERGELLALVGASGSGKSTLMNILAGLDAPTAGSARVAGFDLVDMDADARLSYRRDVVGFVWQQTARNLFPYLTVRQNVLLPMQLNVGRSRRRGRSRRAARAGELLDLLGVAHCHDRRPDRMSGGEQQCAAIAVALANEPELILADEPTGELESDAAEQVLAAFRTVNEELDTTVVLVTHDRTVASAVRRTVAIRDGLTASEVLRGSAVGDDGAEAVTAREYATIDRSGRLQLPQRFTEALAIGRRVVLGLEHDHITVRPGDGPGGADDPPDTSPAAGNPTPQEAS
ncbi:ABC transporter ATP-binding protein [Streptomyces meridianus]|uniref:ABC transporter ATP-binding protein n=1 Tax=Streptomyces meridianus TaxID=2938945 RepID=A0ABT0XCL9_9ACTN|nr:ABC transporter ATP-binding protein [Streptomyces meridianus]MCM2580020.1 ABC transporter ATP-binding protein [Streptomyces meridianus]